MPVNNLLKRKLKEAVVAYFKALSRLLPGELRKSTDQFSQYSVTAYSNHATSDYKHITYTYHFCVFLV
jgi:hypothetical protein